MTANDYAYFAGRAREEDEAVQQAACIESRMSHQQLADGYRRRCSDILLAEAPEEAPEAAADYPTRRQPIVSNRTAVLAASPIAAPRPLLRA
jgi:hypothetical protein